MSRPARRFGGVYVAGSEDPYNRNPGEGQKILFCQDSKFTFHFFAAEDQQSYCYAGKYTETMPRDGENGLQCWNATAYSDKKRQQISPISQVCFV